MWSVIGAAWLITSDVVANAQWFAIGFLAMASLLAVASDVRHKRRGHDGDVPAALVGWLALASLALGASTAFILVDGPTLTTGSFLGRCALIIVSGSLFGAAFTIERRWHRGEFAGEP